MLSSRGAALQGLARAARPQVPAQPRRDKAAAVQCSRVIRASVRLTSRHAAPRKVAQACRTTSAAHNRSARSSKRSGFRGGGSRSFERCRVPPGYVIEGAANPAVRSLTIRSLMPVHRINSHAMAKSSSRAPAPGCRRDPRMSQSTFSFFREAVAASNCSRGATAGAFNGVPSTAKCEPWQGQSQHRSKEFQ